jgi:hypothetical protein
MTSANEIDGFLSNSLFSLVVDAEKIYLVNDWGVSQLKNSYQGRLQ